MKHCAVKFFYALILVVITGAAYGQKASNWVQEEETGCKVYSNDPQTEESVQITGN